MGGSGVNWQFLLAQLVNFLFVASVAALLALTAAVLLGRLFARVSSRFLANLSADPLGLTIPRNFLGASDTYELRRFRGLLILVERRE